MEITYEGIRNWDECDPARHSFAWDEDEEEHLRSLVREWVPPVLSGVAGRITVAGRDGPAYASPGSRWRRSASWTG
jgi:hypothetical protein